MDQNEFDIAQTQQALSKNRNLVLGYLLKLKKSIDLDHSDLAQALTGRFCESAIDYISYGHFRLLNDVTPEPHHRAALENTTRIVLDFDSRYSQRPRFSMKSCRRDLEALALALETRFEVEDEMLDLATA